MEDLEKKINETIEQFACPKGFSCCTEGLEHLCKAREIGLETFLECLEEHPQECPFSVHFGDLYLCECPLRVYIARKLKK
jgi:hypothetical protein